MTDYTFAALPPAPGLPRQRQAGAGALLDKDDRNGAFTPTAWTRKQFRVRQAVIDRLRLWQSQAYRVRWVTLTGSNDSKAERLRDDFAELRRRIGREFGYKFEFVCVDTREGNGVLHMLWAMQGPRFFVPFKWLQAQWQAIHAAMFVNIQDVGGGDGDARRLSRYIVAQYCGGQDALVRLSQSRAAYPLARMRVAWYGALLGLVERYEWGGRMLGAWGEQWHSEFKRRFWGVYRDGWAELLACRSVTAHGVQFVWCDGSLARV